MKTSRRRLTTALVAMVCAVALVLSGCGGGGGGAELSASGRGTELKIQFQGPPVSLDPTKSGIGGSMIFVTLGYDPLIHMDANGGFVPSLATEWAYTDDTMTAFELTIRPDVKFTNGEELTPEAVKNSLQYFVDNAGPLASKVGPVSEITAAGDKVTVHYSGPFPEAEATFTQEYMFGNIISPAGLADPKSLLVGTQGAGQYQLSTEETVTDSSYVYRRNENYWAPEAQMYERATITVIPDPNAVISAVSTGQVDVASGSPSTLEAAKAAGLKVQAAPLFNWTLFLTDKEGVINPALKDVRVRKAIGLAVNRDAIANAIGPEVSEANGQLMNKGTIGYVEGLGFAYDPDEAKRLLAEAGYGGGFDLTILTQNANDNQTMRAQAIASSLREVGIRVHLEVITTGIANFSAEAQSKKYEAVIFPLTGTTMGSVHKDMLQSGLRNPFKITEPDIADLYERSLSAANQDERTAIYQQMSRAYLDKAYVIPVFTALSLYYVGPGVTNINSSALNATSAPTGPTADHSWKPVE